MMLSFLVPVAIVAVIVIIGVLAFQRGRDGFDLSSNAVVRGYLYLGLFAGVLALAFGFSALMNAALATVAGNEFVYGGVPAIRPCPPGVDCPQPPVQVLVPAIEGLERRRLEDVVRGVTFVVFGALFYVAHRWAFGALYPRGTTVGVHGDGLRRAYLMVGTVVFGIGAIALLPMGVYQVVANVLLPRSNNFYQPGVAESLTGGLVSFVFWLIYLRAVLGDARGGQTRFYQPGPSSPPPQPSPVGARIGPAPGERSAGAEAQPPQFRRQEFIRPGERIVRVVRPGGKPGPD